MEPSRERIVEALAGVIDPELRRPVTELDMVRGVEVNGGRVHVTIALTVAGCPLRSSFEQQVAEALRDLPGVDRVSLGFDVMTPEERQALTTKLRGGVRERSQGLSLDALTRVLAVCSGKGGVGKSTLSANLAVALSQLGQRAGILDADVYGHSIPHILGIHQKPVLVGRMIVPPVKGDLKLMSIGFFLDDMPPGTGDVAMSLGQLLPRAEAIVVTTPQPAAQEVAARAGAMAQKTSMRLIGVVENMSGDVFGAGGGEELARDLGIPFLGSIPLDLRLRESGDYGEPLVASDPDAEAARAIHAIAEQIVSEQPGAIRKPLPLVS